MARYALIIEYDGTGFEGWQSQPGGNTVQDTVATALTTCLREPASITGSGRTDAGVHATHQVAHFDSSVELDCVKTFRSMNGLLPDTICVRSVSKVSENFHARYDAIKRTYRYRITMIPTALDRNYRLWVRRKISIDAMNEAASQLLGVFDFSAFCKVQSETVNRICNIDSAVWVFEGDGCWYFEISGDRFLHGMVRAIVGTLFEVGTGKREISSISSILDSGDRRLAGPAAPARGLTLFRVLYPDGSLPYSG
ncbi:MAG: tRNA pseudouridine(38-40) synthase TruA [Rhodothermales bacterium]|nr:tRNA pseudouridine(38-40) synthase TruA [Rhodothermales bacterium]